MSNLKIYVGNIIRTKDDNTLLAWCRNKEFEVLGIDEDGDIWIPGLNGNKEDRSTWALLLRTKVAAVVGDNLQAGDIIHTVRHRPGGIASDYGDKDFEIVSGEKSTIMIPSALTGGRVILKRMYVAYIVKKAGVKVEAKVEAEKPTLKKPKTQDQIQDDEDFEKAMTFFGRHKKHQRGNSGLEFL